MMADQHEHDHDHHRAEDRAHDDHRGVGQANQVQPLCSRFGAPRSTVCARAWPTTTRGTPTPYTTWTRLPSGWTLTILRARSTLRSPAGI